jgi:hypothetical protein
MNTDVPGAKVVGFEVKMNTDAAGAAGMTLAVSELKGSIDHRAPTRTPAPAPARNRNRNRNRNRIQSGCSAHGSRFWIALRGS